MCVCACSCVCEFVCIYLCMHLYELYFALGLSNFCKSIISALVMLCNDKQYPLDDTVGCSPKHCTANCREESRQQPATKVKGAQETQRPDVRD